MTTFARPAPPAEPGRLRCTLLRLLYLVMAVGLAVVAWPQILVHDVVQAHSGTGAKSMLAAMGAFALLGLWSPLKMVWLLVFEVAWKAIFLAAFGLPLLLHGEADPASWENIWSAALAAVFVPIIPWRWWLASLVPAAKP